MFLPSSVCVAKYFKLLTRTLTFEMEKLTRFKLFLNHARLFLNVIECGVARSTGEFAAQFIWDLNSNSNSLTSYLLGRDSKQFRWI